MPIIQSKYYFLPNIINRRSTTYGKKALIEKEKMALIFLFSSSCCLSWDRGADDLLTSALIKELRATCRMAPRVYLCGQKERKKEREKVS